MHNRTCYYDTFDETWTYVSTVCDVYIRALLTPIHIRIRSQMSASLIKWLLTAAQKANLNRPCPHQQRLFMDPHLVQSHLC